MKNRLALLLLGCLVVIALVLSSCGTTVTSTATSTATTTSTNTTTTTTTTTTSETPTTTEDVTGPAYGGVIKMYNHASLSGWDNTQRSGSSVFAYSFFYEQLGFGNWAQGLGGTGEDTYMEYGFFNWEDVGVGCLAESWEWTDDLTITFHIREGIHFWNKAPANGREMTAEDVAFCMNRFKASSESYLLSRNYIDTIEATDEWTVVLKLKEFYPFMEMDVIFGQAGMTYAPEVIDQYGGITDNEVLVATGPFIPVSFVPDTIVEFKRNDNYWGFDELHPENRLPYVDGVDIVYIDDDSTRLAGLRTGKLDMLWRVSLEDAALLEDTNPELERNRTLSTNASGGANIRCDIEPFSDIRVRQAMFMAIDFETIATDYLLESEILAHPFRPDHSYFIPLEDYPEEVQELYSYNPEKAMALLDEAGYANLQTEIINFPTLDSITTIMVDYWDKIGVDCTIKMMDEAAFRTMSNSKVFPAMAASNMGTADAWRTLSRLLTGNSSNYSIWSDPAYDAKWEDILTTFDVFERKQKMQDLSIDWLAAAAFLQLPTPYVYNYWQPWIKGYHGEFSMGGQNNQGPIFARVWLDQDMKKAMGH